MTLAGISDSTSLGVIENTQYETGITSNGVLTINNSANFSFNGYVRDGNFGGSTGALALIKGGSGTLALAGGNSGGYTGGLTINAGTLDYSQGVLPNCTITINGGTLIYPGEARILPRHKTTMVAVALPPSHRQMPSPISWRPATTPQAVPSPPASLFAARLTPLTVSAGVPIR